MGESYVRQLGGKVVEDPMRGTHLITPRVKRTLKFLVILNRGVPILPPLWLQECAQERRIKNPDLFLLKDIESEKKFGFKLSISQEKALSRSFLDNYFIWCSKRVKPSYKKMRLITESAGGHLLNPEEEPHEF